MMTFAEIDAKIKEYESLVRNDESEFYGDFLASQKTDNAKYRKKLAHFEALHADLEGCDDSDGGIESEASKYFELVFFSDDRAIAEAREQYSFDEREQAEVFDIYPEEDWPEQQAAFVKRFHAEKKG